jgi:adenylate cyclase, class 2
MGIETEKKYRLRSGDRERITTALRECGGKFLGQESEENTIFTTQEMTEQASIVRIRNVGDRCLLTFKRRVHSLSDVKEQIEHETVVSNAEETASILFELGLRPRLIYEKKRDTWKFRSVEVVLDELPFGSFMEIEGSRTSIKEAEMILGIEDLETELETYPRLTSRLGKEVDGVIEARFDSNSQ